VLASIYFKLYRLLC